MSEEQTKQSQNEMIFQHMLAGFQITQADAYHLFGCWRLASRINDLREILATVDAYKGWAIMTHMVKNKGKRYASYELVRNDEKE